MGDWSEYEERLRARRASLTQQLQSIEDTLDDEPPKDWEDRAAERQGDEVLEALGSQDLAEVRQIDAALDRVKKGTFGSCVKCGEEISKERLNVLPATPLCKSCAA